MPFNLFGALKGAVDPTDTKQRLTDTLAAQRMQDLEWKRQQSQMFENLVRDGAYEHVEPSAIMDRMNEIWGDHKGNKEHLKNVGEHVDNVHKVIRAITGSMKPQQPPLTTGAGQVSPIPPFATSTAAKPPTTAPTSSVVPPPPAPGGMSTQSTPQIGNFVKLRNGGLVRITKVYADGSFDHDMGGHALGTDIGGAGGQ